ncbi:uncharacterized protein LOC106132400 [Amyelois transitella]|uniref:uncharacterized protein LOC106132400 n=1 Tax=Amyelois transitella TaxID=680683 RepID=UPI00067D585B|nr:uncharacterized protein LOC106132400 [Amyelois transitella]
MREMGSCKDFDSMEISKLVSPFVDHATCLDCCKLYIAPETASCGHTSCHACWRKRKSCVWCAAPLDRSSLKLNVPIQIITEHVHTMCELFEKVFKFKVDTFSIGDGLSSQLDSEPDPTKDVRNWLASSQNQFSAPISFESTQDNVEHLVSTVQVHSHAKKVLSPKKIVLKQVAQDDWEKIEQIPDTEDLVYQNKGGDENNRYSVEHPRRSSRKTELKPDIHITKNLDSSKDKCSSKNSSSEIESKTVKSNQKWNNVKKMRKEFSKLNKQNRNKLNVSIEMCKKNKVIDTKTSCNAVDPNSEQLIDIEDNTPCGDPKKNAKSHSHSSVKDMDISLNYHEYNSMNKNSTNKSLLDNALKLDSNHIHDMKVTKPYTNNTQNVKENNIRLCNSQNDSANGKAENLSKMPFYKRSRLHVETEREIKHNVQTLNYNIDCSNNANADDIEITIKIGDTVANIIFKRKKDGPPKNNVNQEIQTSIGIHTLENLTNTNEQNLQNNEEIVEKSQSKTVEDNNKATTSNYIVESEKRNKSVSTKKNTASAETVTAQFEITDSVEKELSSIMEFQEQESCKKQNSKILYTMGARINKKISQMCTQPKRQVSPNVQSNNDEIEIPDSRRKPTSQPMDSDIFESGSVQDSNIHMLKNVKNIPSEILMPTVKSTKTNTIKKAEKRNREMNDDIDYNSKKPKVTQDASKEDEIVALDKSLQKEFPQDSEGINYDAIMGQVFANIDADIHNSQKETLINDIQPLKESAVKEQQETVVLAPEKTAEVLINIEDSISDNVVAPERHSENVFTIIDKENDSNEIFEDKNQNSKAIEQSSENFTPEIYIEEGDKLFTPHENIDDDDKSVVEETPQKNVSFTKPKSKTENAQQNFNKQTSNNESQVKSVVDVSDSDSSSKVGKEVTIIDIARKQTETPLTINRFVDEIKHKSTPVARKSLNFENDDDDPEQTLCPTTEPAKTTQEKEFMSRAFENTPKSQIRKPLVASNVSLDKPYCLAGSCLSSMELMKVKLLCRQNNWKYIDKYTNELTHLVVGVDDENKSQRSVKYMCALAASKWIISFKWIEVCLSTNKVVNEEFFEALDGTGEPGPKRSRIAKKKLFEGISFYCMPPFSVLDVATLKIMLEAAGGTVVEDVMSVRASESPALLLAEPEDTQENKFIYMAVELSLVPVNYEWVLNCLGSYSLCSIHELLLCPAALLPAAATKWPQTLVSQDD